jgi:septum formation protein
MAPTLLLASNSPRRRQLLALTGWTFQVQPVDLDESTLPGERPQDYVLRLAEGKARAGSKFALPGQIILAADTTVVDQGQILGKPAGTDEARLMLHSLRGREHFVYTAIGICEPQSGRLRTDLCVTKVGMRAYSDAEIEAYIASGDPFDKAGAYAVQNTTFHPVERISGCYTCVVGLPICRVTRLMAAFNLAPPVDITADCSDYLDKDIPCAVYEMMLREEQRPHGASGGTPSGGSPSRGKEK